VKKNSIYKTISQCTQKDVTEFFFQSKKLPRSSFWDVRFFPTTETPNRILIIISKKCGNAPERNKLKRQIKTIFYEEKIYEKGFSWVCIIKKPLMEKSFDYIKKEFMEIVTHVIQKKSH